MKKIGLSLLVIAFLCTGGIFAHNSADAAAVTPSGVFHFRDNRAPNNAGLSVGDRLLFGVSVTPNGYNGTTVEATQGTTTVNVGFDPNTIFPNQFDYSFPYDAALDDVWHLTITNGADTATIDTPSAATAVVVPFVSSVAISAGPDASHPAFTWTLPSGFTPDQMRILIMDLTTRVKQGYADFIYSQSITGSASEFTIPANWILEKDKPYCLLIELRQYAPSTTTTLSRSRSYADFIIPTGGTPSLIYFRKVLWKHTNGTAALWSLDVSDNFVSQKICGPFEGWTPLVYDQDDQGRGKLAWTHNSGMVSIWSMDVLDNFVSCKMYGPFSGWSPIFYKKKHLIWQHTSGMISHWILDGSDDFVSYQAYGPYSGWSPVDLD